MSLSSQPFVVNTGGLHHHMNIFRTAVLEPEPAKYIFN